jgi:hypothetical protein
LRWPLLQKKRLSVSVTCLLSAYAMLSGSGFLFMQA